MSHETMADLAALGKLEGRRVRLREDVGSFVPAGAVGLVLDVRTTEARALVRYRVDRPWAYQDVESPFYLLELVGADDDPKCP